jgi:hypothetical protein
VGRNLIRGATSHIKISEGRTVTNEELSRPRRGRGLSKVLLQDMSETTQLFRIADLSRFEAAVLLRSAIDMRGRGIAYIQTNF